jgi:GAF domain-containing protein
VSTSNYFRDSAVAALDIAVSALRYENLSDLTAILRDLGLATDSFAVLLWELVPGIDPKQESQPGQLFVLADWLRNESRYASHNLPLNSLTGTAITNNETLICTDVTNDPRVYHGPPDFFGAYNIKSFVTIPVRFGDSELGALNLYRSAGLPISDLGISVAQAFVRVLPGIYGGLREKGSLKLVGTLNSIVQKYEGDPDRLQLSTAKKALQEMAATISQGFRCLETSIYLVQTDIDPNKARLEATTFEPFVRRPEYQIGHQGLTGWILKERRPLRVPDLKYYNRDQQMIEARYPGLTGFNPGRLVELLMDKLKVPEASLQPASFMGVPILLGEELLGVIRCCTPLQAPYYYSERDEKLLALVASQVGHFWRNWVEAGAIENENHSWESLVNSLNDLIRGVSSQSKLKEVAILEHFLNVAEEVIPGADIFDIRLFDPKKNDLYFAATKGKAWDKKESDRTNKRFSLDGKSAGAWVFKNNKTRIMLDVTQDELYNKTFPDVRSMVITPISSGKEEYGVLDVRITNSLGIPPNTPAIAEALGRQLGLYLHLLRTLRRVSAVEKKLKQNISQLEQSEKEREQVLEIQRRVFEDLEHQLKLPVLQAHARLSTVLSKKLPADKVISSMNAVRGLLRKAERVVRGMGIFVTLARENRLKRQLDRLQKAPLVKLLIEICMDCIFLEGHNFRGLHFRVNDVSFDILDSLDVKCDPNLLEQAIYDIVDNACKYSFRNQEIDHDNFHCAGPLAKIRVLCLSSVELMFGLPAAYSVGRKIDNEVPWPLWPVLLFIRMLPRCFSRMPRVIHRPRPVPTSVLVVKNGWKIFFLCLGSIPLPVSRMVMRTP